MKPFVLALLVGVMIGFPAVASAEMLASVVERCAPHVAPRTVLAIISRESGGTWWDVGDNDQPAPNFADPEAAIEYAERRVAEGGNIDIGLAQLNSSHLAAFHVTVREAFEPCTNVALGMNVLHEAWLAARAKWGFTPTALVHAFEAYNGGEGSWTTKNAALRAKVDRYAADVWRIAAGIELETASIASSGSVHVHRQATTVRAPVPRVTVFYRAPKGSGV